MNEDLRAAVLARHRSIHAFCRVHPELARATVYQVLSGRYAGNMPMQTARIRAALGARPTAPGIDAGRIAAVLQEVKCGRCRRADRRGCRGCRIQTGREAEAVTRFLDDIPLHGRALNT